MKKPMAFILVLCMAGSLALAAQSWDTSLPSSLDTMAENYYLPVVQTVFGTFTYAYSGIPSPFARWLEDNLGSAIAKSSRLKLLNRSAAAAMDPLFAKEYGEFFSMADGAALLHGSYFVEDNAVRARLELTGLSDRTLIGVIDITIPRKNLPKELAVEPSKAVLDKAKELDALLPAASPDGLKVSVTTDRGAGAVYRLDEEMTLLVTANKDAYAKVYHIDAAGTAQLIWPNRFGGSGMLKAGEITRIPNEAEKIVFQFIMIPPLGTEFIKVIASTVPFAENEEGFTSLGKDVKKAVTRGLAIRPVSAEVVPERAEALASYVIMQK
jgi:hypothetical protein